MARHGETALPVVRTTGRRDQNKTLLKVELG